MKNPVNVSLARLRCLNLKRSMKVLTVLSALCVLALHSWANEEKASSESISSQSFISSKQNKPSKEKPASAINKKPLLVYVIGNEKGRDNRHAYEIDLIHLLLDKTVMEFGAYTSKAAPKMGHLRGLLSIRENTYPNFVRTFGYQDDLVQQGNVSPIYYPVYRGLLGYRTCFLSEKIC